MIRKPSASKLLFLCGFIFAAAISMNAQATRTWISGVGDDANPCSRTAPCKTFAGAISKTVGGGEINCLDPGGFGAVTLTKSVTLDCSGTLGSILAAGTTGIVINSPTAIVRLRGITINGTSGGPSPGANGIRIMAAARVTIENVVVEGFASSGISVESANDIHVTIAGSSIRNNAIAGISAVPAMIAEVFVWNSSVTANGTGISAGPNSTFRLSGNMITANTTGLATQTRGKIISFKDNAIDGNTTNGVPTGSVLLQ